MKSKIISHILLVLAFLPALLVVPHGAVNAEDSPARAQATTQASLAFWVTPNPDGSVYHRVQKGDTLFSIARQYGVSIEELKRLNKIGDNNVVFLDTWMIIRAPNTATPTYGPSVTPTPDTPTPAPSFTAEIPTSTLPPTPTLAPTPAGFFAGVPGFFSRNLGGVLVGLLMGLALGAYFAQFGRKRR